MNIKEIHSFSFIQKPSTVVETTPPANDNIKSLELPKELFNVICDTIIHEILHPEKIIITEFRDIIYDILVYNLDAADCIWYILTYFINSGRLSTQSTSEILIKSHSFFKYYNNNYRPIYHLENIFVFILNRIHGYNTNTNTNINTNINK